MVKSMVNSYLPEFFKFYQSFFSGKCLMQWAPGQSAQSDMLEDSMTSVKTLYCKHSYNPQTGIIVLTKANILFIHCH